MSLPGRSAVRANLSVTVMVVADLPSLLTLGGAASMLADAAGGVTKRSGRVKGWCRLSVVSVAVSVAGFDGSNRSR